MSAASAECILFAGPSLPAAGLRVRGVSLRPPACRGEIAALATTAARGVIALADGVFHQTLAVGHSELRDAVRAGWQVWGLSSLGAIRACEMRDLGVRGFGVVYQRFIDDPEFSDDEVALLHTPDAPYRAVSEPLIHIRIALDALAADGVISSRLRRALLARLKKSWYGDRTLGLVRCTILAHEPAAASAVDAWLDGFDRFRVKTLDLQRFVAEQPWLHQSQICWP